MLFVTELFKVAIVSELLVHLLFKWPKLRTLLAIATVAILLTASAGIVGGNINLFSILLFVLSLYRVVNMFRVIKQRMHEVYLLQATRRTSLVLILAQGFILGSWWLWDKWHSTNHALWAVVAGIQLISALILLLSTMRTLRHTAWRATRVQAEDSKLPSITVAIPARNETEDLQLCLESILKSDYPKLEVIVLDDCSQTKRTPEIIGQFAHDGVRFIQGQEPESHWLAKNYAYERLSQEASGNYILFCGVDVRFRTESIRKLVSAMQVRHKQMLSVLPLRQYDASRSSTIIQSIRYWWELALPRRLLNRPPVLSTCWIISAKSLQRAGGFRSVTRAIVPEAYFARKLVKTDEYSFIRADNQLGIDSNKAASEQLATAVRMRYPQVHRRPEHLVVTMLFEAGFLLLPLILAVAGFWVSIGVVAHIEAIVASFMLTATFASTMLATRVSSWWFALLGLPFSILTDIWLLNYSMLQYEFSVVDWKGRNVCLPVMHTTPFPTQDLAQTQRM